jgi:hypothetical protein
MVTVEGEDEPLNVTTIFFASSSYTTPPMLVTMPCFFDLEAEYDLVAVVRREEDACRIAARAGAVEIDDETATGLGGCTGPNPGIASWPWATERSARTLGRF